MAALDPLLWNFYQDIFQKVSETFRAANIKSSYRRWSVRKGVLRNFAKFTGKHLCQSLFFNKATFATLLKKKLWHRSFPVKFVKFLRALFYTEHLWATASTYGEYFVVFIDGLTPFQSNTSYLSLQKTCEKQKLLMFIGDSRKEDWLDIG